MSLSSFLDQPEIRAGLREQFRKPSIRCDQPLLAEPRSKRYALIGAAFDYLLRFFVERLNPGCHSERWVAEAGLSKLGVKVTDRFTYNVDTEELSFSDDDDTLEVGRKLLRDGQSAHKRYLKSGSVSDSVLRGVIGLAQLETFYRCGMVADDFGTAHREDMRDLRRLISLVNPAWFLARKICFLNPSFGIGSKLVGGADADLLIDDTLIEIKTTGRANFTRDYFNQLLGYLAMLEIWGITGVKRALKLSKIGVYFARHASMQLIEIEDIAPRKQFLEFFRWFRESVEEQPARNLSGPRTKPLRRKRKSALLFRSAHRRGHAK